MFIVESYGVAVALCFVTMLCWGSWANTQKLASQEWRFQLFYWDYSIGVLLLALLLAFTLGSSGEQGRAFMPDISQASTEAIQMALLGGAVFNLANILLVVAIDIAGMAVAFPVGIGLALVIGVMANFDPDQVNNLASDPAHRERLEELSDRLDRRKVMTGVTFLAAVSAAAVAFPT